jgi:hypothetical protein
MVIFNSVLSTFKPQVYQYLNASVIAIISWFGVLSLVDDKNTQNYIAY